MALDVRSFSDITRKDVFTLKGHYTGKVVDIALDLERFRVKSLIIDAVKGSFLSSLIGDKRGVVIPFNMVQAVGDIVLIKHITSPSVEEFEEHPTPQSDV